MKRIINKISIIVLGITFIFIGSTTEVYSARKAPHFWRSNLEGERFNTRKNKKPYIISFFFVNCVPCQKEIPELHKLMTTEFPNVTLLFIDPLKEDTPEAIKELAKKLDVPLKYFYHDAFGSVGKKFFKGKMKFPTIFGVKNQRIIFRYPGLPPEAIDGIREALKG